MLKVQQRQVTFTPPAEAAYLIGDFTDWKQRPLAISGPVTLEFPPGAYVEYAFLDIHKKPLADPANANVPAHPWHAYDRFIMLPENPFSQPPRPHKFRGQVFEHAFPSRVFEKSRMCYVYEPAESPTATLFVQDGAAFYHKLQFQLVAEALLERKIISPVRLVMLEPDEREKEYWLNERYEHFLLQEVLPWINGQYGETARKGLWGASLGGLTAAWLAWKNPQLFTLVGCQSGCFTAQPGGCNAYSEPEWFTAQFAATPRQPLRFYMQTGQIEWLLAPNRRFAAVLADKTYPHLYSELPSGHTWATWEQGLAQGLAYLLNQ
ncbi:esterase family protein [Ktedonosporobacter rubrisoli]|uniref:Esterase family protein n=1 Tax=Ktedonosporobacter rubrisoli TaxID=2509675 RepID=A0A4P6JLK2_KTERU|nr:alpha/beta hydrolase-fold protein [Ktedonosporobacter rubrisoli]QBD76099.1 esterase family protein [Ktedonosporobacter rubrisoli]